MRGWTLAVAALAAILCGPADAQQASPGQPVPAGTAHATKQDFPVFLSGLGTVQPFSSVIVRARVDGTLLKVPVTEGQEVKAGELIAVIDPRPYQATLDQALAKKAQDEAQLANARQDLARYASLVQKDFASHQQMDTQQAQVNQLLATIKGDEATIANAQLNLSFCFIQSPIDGRVGFRQVDPGNIVHASEPGGIMTLTQVHPISVVFTLPQNDLPAIVDGMAAGQLPVMAYASDDKTQLDKGVLLTPDNMIDTATGTIKLKATFPNQSNRLWPGQFVNARLLVGTRQNVLTIPSAAVQHGPIGLYVYLVNPDRTVQLTGIGIDLDNGRMAIVTRGLEPGAEVVVSGHSRLQTGSKIADAKPGDPKPSGGGNAVSAAPKSGG